MIEILTNLLIIDNIDIDVTLSMLRPKRGEDREQVLSVLKIQNRSIGSGSSLVSISGC